MLIRLVAPGQPVSGKNNKRAFVHTSKKTGNLFATISNSKAVTKWYDSQVPVLAAQWRGLGLPTLRQLVTISLDIHMRDSLLDTHSPDGDNVLSAVQDALVKAEVMADDRFIKSAYFDRHGDAERPRVEIEIRLVERP